MSNSIIELHDSTVSGIAQLGRQVVVCFLPAYIHRSEGVPGVDSGTGWVRTAVLHWTDAEVKAHHFDAPEKVWSGRDATGVIEFPDYISSGELMVDGHPSPNEIPIPFEAPGAVELRFTLAESAISVTITGVGASLSLIGDAVYVEDSPWQGGKIE